MKKLIAVSVALALAATGAFAQELNIGGMMSFATDIVSGDDVDGNDAMTTVPMNLARLQGSGSINTGVGDFGGWIRIRSGGWISLTDTTTEWDPTLGGSIGMDSLSANVEGYAWWAPNDMFKMTMGLFSDGWLAMDGRARWNFYRMVNDNIGMGFGLGGGYAEVPPSWADPLFAVYAGTFDNSFFSGVNNGLLLQLSPMDMLDVNIMLPVAFAGGGDKKTEDMFAELTAQVGLNLDFGTIGLTYRGSSAEHNNGSIFAYLGLSAIENVGIDFGVGFHLTENANGDSTSIIGIGAAVDVAVSAEFGLIARINAEIRTEENVEDPMGLMFELLPSYALTPNVKGFLAVGLALNTYDLDSDPSPSMGFHIGPYLEVGSTWGPTFYAGFELKTVSHDGSIFGLTEDYSEMRWRIPIGMYIAF